MRSPDLFNMWPTPHIIDSVGGRIRSLNTNVEPRVVHRHEHVCMACPTTSSNFVEASPIGTQSFSHYLTHISNEKFLN